MRRLTYGVIGTMLCLVLASCQTSCAKQNPEVAKLSPEGKAAYYGEKFLRLVEQAQDQTIALVGTNGITKADVAPAVEVYVQIFQGGKELAAALKIIDESKITEAQQSAAVRVRASLDAFQDLLNGITVHVSSERTRTLIDQIIKGLKLGAALFDVVTQIGPFVPASPPPVSWTFNPVGGVA
jgi:hypothetical protein